MAGRIFAIQKDGTLHPMTEAPYADEDLFQRLLSDYPDLLVGEQINEETPRRWMLVSREVGVPLEAEGGDTFSVDHLFLDQDGVPTLVEVKRSSDHRIRREVVGQMLDYAAHAVAHWRPDAIRTRFEGQCAQGGADPMAQVAELIDADPSDEEAVEAYWAQVGTNLRAGRIRLMFVADVIGGELRRVIEFLNRFMDPVEVLGVEIRQYQGRGLRTLVPRLVGQTMATQGKAGTSAAKRQWDEESYFRELEERRGPDEARVARAILEWAKPRVTRVWWGRGQDGNFVPTLDHHGRKHQVFGVVTRGVVDIYFLPYSNKPPFSAESKRLDLLERLNTIPGVSISRESIRRYPKIRLATLLDEKVLQQFLAVYDWYLDEVRKT